MAVLGDEPQPQQERADGGVADDEYMKEYQQYKEGLLKGSRNAATAIALYLLVTAGGKAALCALYGSLGTNLYLLWMFYDVDNVKGTDVVPYRKAQQLENVSAPLKWVAKLIAAYMHALRPRLLVPVAITAAAWAFSQANPDEALTTLDYGCILLGFLSYKGALVTQIVQELSPKGYGEESTRPRVEQIEDELDMLGRPKKRSPLPTAALPDSVDTSKIPTPIIHSDDD